MNMPNRASRHQAILASCCAGVSPTSGGPSARVAPAPVRTAARAAARVKDRLADAFRMRCLLAGAVRSRAAVESPDRASVGPGGGPGGSSAVERAEGAAGAVIGGLRLQGAEEAPGARAEDLVGGHV